MKAIRFDRHGAPDVLELVEIDAPQPAPGQVQVRVHAAGVNPADYKWRNGFNLRYMPLPLPHVPGYDVAGIVSGVGQGVTAFALGDRVVATVNEAYAEYAVAEATACAKLPDQVDFVQAAALPCSALTGMEMIEEGLCPSSGDTVLVTGATGGVGRFAAKAARDLGARVIVAVRPTYVDEVRKLGFEDVVTFDNELPDDLAFDHVADTVGGEAVARLCRRLKPGGRIITVATTPIAPEGLPTAPTVFGYHADGERLSRIVAAVGDGSMQMPVARTFPLAEAAAAQQCVEDGSNRGRVVITID
jgi:NADPH2:quinone reductase